MADEKLRLVSLSVRGGPLNGRRHDPEEVVTEILIGSDPDCHLVVDLPGVSPIHARIWADLDESVVYDTHALRGLWVNATRVEGQAPLGEGDVLWLGPPEDPESACIQCQFAPWVEVLPASLVDSAPGTPALPEGQPVTPDAAAAALAEAFATPEATAASAEVPAAPAEAPPPREEVPAAPAEAPAAPAEAPSASAPPLSASPEEDPFFVGEGPDTGFVTPPAPAAVVKAPPPAGEEPVKAGVAPVLARPVEADQSLSPEALVAETIAEDWAVAAPEPAAPAGRRAPPPARPSAPPAAVPAADEFFIAEEAGTADAAALFVEARPLPAAPPLSPPVPSSPALEAPPPPVEPASLPPKAPAVAPAPVPAAPPQRFVPEAHPEEQPRPKGGTPVEAARVEPRRTAPSPRPAPTPARRPAAAGTPRPAPSGAARPAPARRPSVSARPARRPSRGAPAWIRPVGFGAGGVVVAAALAFSVLRLLGGGVRLEAVEPARVRVGQRATLAGSGFAADPSANRVLFDDREAKVVQASATHLEVEVPEVVTESGAERRVLVVVRRGSRASSPLEVAVFQGPRLHGISPAAALPGEVVLLAGAGWGPGATVRFGAAEAQIEAVDATRIRAVVPGGAGGPGTAASVVVTVGGVDSNAAPFIVGHLPVVSTVLPASVTPGDIVDVSGLGFQADPLANDVRVDGVPALVVSSAGDALRVVVPHVGPGDGSRALEVRVPGSGSVGQAVLEVAAPADPVGFHFVAEPFVAAPGRPHAVLATGLGPAFVLAASGGRTAAARAVESATRLNEAAQALRMTLGLNLEARDVDSSPTLGLAGRPETLLEVTSEDAAAYDEDWTGMRGRGSPVTRARLARWWEAVGRDVVLLTVRGERPQFAAALAPEGRVLAQLFDAAQRTGRPGVPRQVVDEARPALREGLRLLALRVPASVAGPAPASAATPALPVVAATPRPGPLALEGTWTGSQSEAGQTQYLTVRFRRSGGTIAYEGGITLTVPLLTLEQTGRDQARFSVQLGGGVRHYVGKWDGERLSGPVSTDAAGRNVVASFELRKR